MASRYDLEDGELEEVGRGVISYIYLTALFVCCFYILLQLLLVLNQLLFRCFAIYPLRLSTHSPAFALGSYTKDAFERQRNLPGH